MRINIKQYGRGICAYAHLMFLAAFTLSLASPSIFALGSSDYAALGCIGCHGPTSNIDVSGYTHESLESFISANMPFNDPSLCTGDCANDLSHYLLPLSDFPLASAKFSSNLIGASPLEATFLVGASKCGAGPCTFAWNFGDGTTETQTGSFPGLVPDITHTYTTSGTYRVTLTVTDTMGRSDVDVIHAYVVPEESFADYVESCKAELGFDDDDIPNDLNCATGYLFGEDGGIAINDFTDYRKITSEVDLVFACRWLQNGTGTVTEVLEPPFIMAASIEMLMHNRVNGKTCFFRAKEHDIPISDPGDFDGTRSGSSVEIVSPTVAADALPGTTEYEYWQDPMELAKGLPCVDCHVAGPYIASPRIAPFLQRFGLLNDGHDTYGRALSGYFNSFGNYHIVGDTFGFMNHLAAFNNKQNTCADGCHAIGTNSITIDIVLGPVPKPNSGFLFAQLLPAIQEVINGFSSDVSVTMAGVMPANAPPTGNPITSHYTWINRGNPFVAGSQGDNETFVEAKQAFSELLNYCGDPGNLYAHLVGSDEILLPQPFSDHLSVFNARDGVICLKSEQSDGQCNDFRVRYQCTDSSGNVSLTDWYNTDSPNNDGDFERRADHANVCPGQEVTGIEASSTISTGWTGAIAGPVDRLAQFNRYGLLCKNSDQSDGQCDNYVVKFVDCSDAPEAYTARISSVWSGRVLTASDTYNNAVTKAQPSNSYWNSQDWVVQPVTGTGYVRLKNAWSGRYLNTQSENEFADIVVYDYVDEWGSQQWIVEPVPGSSDVRFKNVWTGKYLTVNSAGDYADIKSQALNPSWPSQRWQIQE